MNVPAVNLRLAATALSRDALTFLRSMAGREARGSVLMVRSGSPMVTVRLGGHTFAARLQAGTLTQGQPLYVRIDREAANSFRLTVLGGQTSLAGEGASLLAKDASATLLRQLLLRDPLSRIRPARAGGTRVEAEALAGVAADEGGTESDWVLAAWKERPGGQQHSGPPFEQPPQEAPTAEQGSEDEGAGEPATAAAQYSQSENRVLVRLDFPETGAVAIGIWPTGDQSVALAIECERPATASRIRAAAERWRSEFEEAGLELHSIVVGAGDGGPRAGLDIKA